MDGKTKFLALAQKIKGAILSDMQNDWDVIAAKILKDQMLSDDAIKYTLQQANRAIKLYFLSSDDPEERKLPGRVIHPEKVINLINASTEKTASQEKTVDLSVYFKKGSLVKQASAKITPQEIEKMGYSDFSLIHDILSKYAHKNYATIYHDIRTAAKYALDKLAYERSKVEDEYYKKLKEVANEKQAAKQEYRDLIYYGGKKYAEKIASDFGVYSIFLQETPIERTISEIADPERIINLEDSLSMRIRRISQGEEMLNRLLVLAKDYKIVTDTLKRYIDGLVTAGKIDKLNEIIAKLDII